MGLTFLVLAAVELTIAKTKQDALFFAMCVLFVGLAFRVLLSQDLGIKDADGNSQGCRDGDARICPPAWKADLVEGQKIMVAARGITPVLSFALDEAQLRKATLCVLYVKEIAVFYAGGPTMRGRPKWQEDPEANAIMSLMLKLGAERNLCVLPVYAVSEDASTTILDLAATLGVDFLIIGASQRHGMAKLLRGSVATNVAQQLPESIQLVIFG